MYNDLLECLLDANLIQELMDIQVHEVELEKTEPYMVGLYNGLAIAKATCDKKEADIRSIK